MTTTAYDMPRLYEWRTTRPRPRRALRVAKVVATLAALVPTAAFVAMLAGGLSANVMVTGSMEPRIPVGSLLLYEKVAPEALRRGDVVSFVKPNANGAVTTHRVVDIGSRDGKPVFRTKGDNNAIVDPWLIHYESGHKPRRLAHVVPYVGHAVTAAQRPLVRGSLLVLVLGWLYASFLRALARGKTRPAAGAKLTVPPGIPAAAPTAPPVAGDATPRIEAAPSISPAFLRAAGSRRRAAVPLVERRRHAGPAARPTRTRPTAGAALDQRG